MKVDESPPPRPSSLKWSRKEEEEEEQTQNHSGRSRYMDKNKSLSDPASHKINIALLKARKLISFTSPLSLPHSLFKLSTVDGKSVEDYRNFPKDPDVITFI